MAARRPASPKALAAPVQQADGAGVEPGAKSAVVVTIEAARVPPVVH